MPWSRGDSGHESTAAHVKENEEQGAICTRRTLGVPETALHRCWELEATATLACYRKTASLRQCARREGDKRAAYWSRGLLLRGRLVRRSSSGDGSLLERVLFQEVAVRVVQTVTS